MTNTITPTTTTGGSGPMITVPGIGTGLNTTALVNALLASYEQPITNIETTQKQLGDTASLWQTLSTDLTSLQTASQALSTPSDWQSTQASSSDQAVATGTTSGNATVGSVSFTVDRLAQGETLVSTGSVAAPSDVITSASSLLVSEGTAALGFSSASGSGLSLGSHDIAVTQASSAARITGTSAPASSTTIGSSNDTVTVSADGTSYTLTLASGTYSPSGLAQALTSAASAAGAPLSAAIGTNGKMVVSTTNQGSSTSLQLTGGTALGAAGLTTSSSAVTGTDAIVNVDGTSTTVSNVTAGETITATSGTGGSVALTVGADAHLAVGSITAQDVSTGNGSLTDVVDAINSAGAGVTASAVSNGSGYLLDLSSTSTGADANIGISTTAFSSSPLGDLQVAGAAQNAEISLGGAGGPIVESSTNQVSGLLPGLTADLTSVSASPVTLTVSPDGSAMASKVKAMVDAANKVLSDIAAASQYDTSTKTGGPLLGSPLAEQLTQQVLSIVSTTGSSSGLGNLSAVGITENKGTIDFNSKAFESAYQANPSGVESLFSQGGNFTPASTAYSGGVQFVYAGNSTQPGSYNLVVDHSATQATDTGTVSYSSGSSTIASSDTITVTSSSNSVSYQATAGESLSQTAAGLDKAFAAAGISVSAQTVSTSSGTSIQLTSAGYGSDQTFTVAESGSAFGLAGTYTGTNVSGTINGMAATGNGQVLSAPNSNATLDGLSFLVTIPGIASATTIGSYTYTPGAAQALTSLASNATSPVGEVTTQIQNLQQQQTNLDPELAMYQQIAKEEKTMLDAQFSKLDATLATLNQQGSTIASALAGGSSSSSGSSGSGAL